MALALGERAPETSLADALNRRDKALRPPLAERIDSVVEETDLDDVYETERHLLYVACTRARLLVSGVAPGSEFLKDLGAR